MNLTGHHRHRHGLAWAGGLCHGWSVDVGVACCGMSIAFQRVYPDNSTSRRWHHRRHLRGLYGVISAGVGYGRGQLALAGIL